MKRQSSHRVILVELAALLTLMFLATPWAPMPHSTAQQRNRQLRIEPKQNGAEQRRIALVIGNGAYVSSPLKNPANDATDMAATLSKVGFTVEHGVNLTQRQMKAMIREFGQKLKGGGQGLFYFAGHGVQLRGRNYLIPVDAEITSESDVEDQGVDANLVLGLMDEAGNGLNVIILDACRNNPFARSFRSAGNGLAQVDAPTGTLVAYATAPGKVARDGNGRNGAYTAELLKQMGVPGLTVEELLKRVRASLKHLTNGEQVPWESSSLVGDFYLNNAGNVNPARPNIVGGASNLSTIDAVAVEREYWETIRSSNEGQDYKDYLEAYPNGAYAAIARAKIRQLEVAKNTPPNTQPTKKSGNGASEAEGSLNAGASRPNVRNQQGIEMVYIPPGSFLMGDGTWGSEPVHEVTINYAFYMGKYEVTQGQWQALMGSNPSKFTACGSNCPVERVSFSDAQEFINKLNATNDGYKYQLPSEAEWEYACRAGTTGYLYAPEVNDIGWYEDNSGRTTHAGGGKQSNAYGLYDMSGNVYEWCRDFFNRSYKGAPTDGSAWVSGDPARVLRGGSWGHSATTLGSAFRSSPTPDLRIDDVGFRVVAVVRTQ